MSGSSRSERFDVAQRRRAAEHPDLHHRIVLLEGRDVGQALDVERWRDPDANDPEGGDVARVAGRGPFGQHLARVDLREVAGGQAEGRYRETRVRRPDRRGPRIPPSRAATSNAAVATDPRSTSLM